MQIIDEIVIHKVWEKGTIIKVDGAYITIHFDKIQDDKSFIYPDAFEKFLTFEKDSLQATAEKAVSDKQQKLQQEREKREAESKKVFREQPIKVEKTKSGTRKKKLPPRKNLAFKLNYCDGGATADSVGYKGVCSDETIRYNIEVAKRSWCSYKDCPCRRYLDGDITRKELDTVREKGFTCYESISLSDWIAQAGTDLKGENEGKARRLPNAQLGSLAVLTTRFPDDPEQERVIVGAFIVDAASEGDDDDEGTVSCRSKYHLEIRPNEVRKLKFWNYYRNEGNPDSIRWGTGLYRFFRDEDALRLLKDIVELKKDTADYGLAVDTLEYFEELHSD